MEADFSRRLRIGPTFFSLLVNPLKFLEEKLDDSEVIRFRIFGRNIVISDRVQDIRRLYSNNNCEYLWRDGVKAITTATGPGAFGVCDGDLYRRFSAPAKRTFQNITIEESAKEVTRLLQSHMDTRGNLFLTQKDIENSVREAVMRLLFRNDVADLHNFAGNALRSSFAYMNSPLALLQNPLLSRKYRAAVQRRKALDHEVEKRVAHRRTHLSKCPMEADRPGDLIDSYLLSSSDVDTADSEIRQQVIETIAAGQETTTATIQWMLIELSRDPDIVTALQQEIAAAAGGRRYSMKERPVATAIIYETLRLHPPVPVAPRSVAKEGQFGGRRVRRGDMVFISQKVTHRSPRHWRDADSFKPSRWLEGQRTPVYTYFPFGLGQRKCMGRTVAMGILYGYLTHLYSFALVNVSVKDRRPTGIVTQVPRGFKYVESERFKHE